MDRPTITLNTDFTRPDAHMVARFRGAPTGNVSDAAGRIAGLPIAIKPLTRADAFCGVALTVDNGRAGNLGVWAALAHIRPGDVLVIATHDNHDRAVIGDLLAGYAFNAGAVAIVTDGLVRDLVALEPFDRPVFAAGATPVGPLKTGSVSVGLPITLGRQTIRSGDVIVGDRDGIAVAPGDALPDVIAELEALTAREAVMEAEVKAGMTIPTRAAEVLGDAQIIHA